jgi:N-acetylglucosamine-6-sulfatase
MRSAYFSRLTVFPACLLWAGLSPAAAADRPNILFVLTDDQRWDFMGCAGHPYLETPNMDRLAREGSRFAQAFATTSLCSPSRASFLTGEYARMHGVTNNNYEFNFGRHPTFAEHLQKAGYDTAYVGKWHMGWSDRWRPGYGTWISFEGQGAYFDQTFTVNDKPVPTKGYITDVTTDFAIEWLRRERAKPFMLQVGYKAPHQPWTPAPRHKGLYAGKTWNASPAAWTEPTDKPDYVIEHAGAKTKPPREKRQKNLDTFVQQLSECVKGIDENLGRLLDALGQMGELDNTLVVFASDNGYFIREHGLGDKRAMYEPSIRIAFLARYPRLIKPGTVFQDLVLNIDLAPTLLELGGLEVPGTMQGRSLVPLFRGNREGWREDFLYEYLREEPYMYPTVYGVRARDWAYMHYPDLPGQDELYDMAADPHQLKNVIKDSDKAAHLQRMKERLARLEKEIGPRAPANTVPDTGEWRKGKSTTVPSR